VVSKRWNSPLRSYVEDGQPLSALLVVAPRIDSKVMASRMMNMIMILSTYQVLDKYESRIVQKSLRHSTRDRSYFSAIVPDTCT